ncbi:TPA: hypothetical protein ACIVL5_001659 [Salmonella enterica subsp. diarizonae serovar 61:r:-]
MMIKGARRCGYTPPDYAGLKKAYADMTAAKGNPEAEAAVMARCGGEILEDGTLVFSSPLNRRARRAAAKVFRKPKNKGGRK